MENHIELETSHKRDKGFTLVELLIVIVILGILATVTVFAVRGITDKGKKSACDADRKTLETAIEAYYAYTNTYPAATYVAPVYTDLVTALVPTYTKSVPANFTYATVGAPATSFTLVGKGQCL